MLHNTGPYGPNETPVNMGAPLNISQLSTPMNMVQNLNNLSKMPPQPSPAASGHFSLPNYPPYGNPAANLGSQMHPFQNYHPLGFQPSYMHQNSSVMQNTSWQNPMLPMSLNMHEDHSHNMLNYGHLEKRMLEPSSSNKEQQYITKTPINIPQVPNKLFQRLTEPISSAQTVYNDDFKPYNSYKEAHNSDFSLKSPESLLSDNTRRKNLENTVRLIENILINTTKNRDMEQNSNKSEKNCHYMINDKKSNESSTSRNNYVSKVSSPIGDDQNNSDCDDETGDDPDDSDGNDDIEDLNSEPESRIEKVTENISKDVAKVDVCRPTPVIEPEEMEVDKADKQIMEKRMENNVEVEIVPVIKQEPIEVEKQVIVKIEQINSWTDTENMTPFPRDMNGVTREDVRSGDIVDSDESVAKALEALKNGTDSNCYYECPNCCLLFKHPKRLLIHTKWHSYGFITERKLEIAKEKEDKYHTTRLRECKICGKKCSGWATWKAHQSTHNTESGFQCTECPKRFKYAHSLSKHRDTHLEKTHECPECPKKFGSQNLLKVHLKSHERARQGASFHCTYCGKSFYDKFNLQIHERTHTNERPFVCEICNATFGCNSNLSRHLKVSHSAAKPHVCSTCNRSFATALIRDRHEMRLHGDPNQFKYTCKLCPSRYLKQVDLRKHTYKMHPKPKVEKAAK